MPDQKEPKRDKPCNCSWQYGSTRCLRHKEYDEWQARQ